MPSALYIRGCSSMVEHQPSKLDTWVRFPSPAYKSKVNDLAFLFAKQTMGGAHESGGLHPDFVGEMRKPSPGSGLKPRDRRRKGAFYEILPKIRALQPSVDKVPSPIDSMQPLKKVG